MAIDGVKIIDSDLAHDVYSELMDLYDNNVDIKEIKTKIEKWKEEDLDEVEYEIFITTYSLALWEIGELPKEILHEVETVIEKRNVAKMFLEEAGEKEYKARIKETEKLLQKIKSENSKIRKRKKYKKVVNLLFSKGDMFYYVDTDNTHYCGLVYGIDQYRGRCTYNLAICDYKGSTPVFSKVVKKYSVLGRKIPSGIKTTHGNYVLGIDIVGVEHKDLISFKDNLITFGTVSLKENFTEVGSFGYSDSFEKLKERFINQENRRVLFNSINVPLASIIETKM